MNSSYSSSIDQFFIIKYDENGQRIRGRCRFCPNLCIKGHNTSNYWHHLHVFHQSNYNSHRKRSNFDNLNDNNNNNNNNNDNSNTVDIDNFMMENDTENEEIINIAIEHNQNNSKRIKINESKQSTIQFATVSVSRLTKFHKLTAETFAKLGLPHNLVDNNEFKQLFIEFELLKCDNLLKFASIRGHKRHILDSAAEKFNEVLKLLQDNLNVVTLAIDGWTGHSYGAKNTNIIALCNGKSYLLWSDRNSDLNDGTENYLFPLINEKIQFLLAKNVAICAITTDNATNMLNLGKELYKLPNSGPVILHLSCSAHTIQLMLQDIVGLEPIYTVIRDALAMIEPFIAKNGKKLRLDLRKSQISSGLSPLKLVLFNQTRWLSRFETINRLIKLKTHIKWVFLSNSMNKFSNIQQETFWTKLEHTIQPLLLKFKLATNMVQQDSASLYTLDQALTGIRAAINDCKLSEHLLVTSQSENAFKFNANEILNERIQQYVLGKGSHYAFWAVSLLTDKRIEQWESSFGDMNRDYAETVGWIGNWGSDLTLFYPNHFKVKCENNKSAIVSTINRQIAEFETGLATFSNKQQYLRDYTQLIPQNSVNFDANSPEKRETDWLLFWSKMKIFAPELSNVATCLLSLAISEASCERSFSVQKLTHSKLRNRLNDQIVEAEMIIRFNKCIKKDYEALSEASDSE
jgi:hypothetical protein